jgi:hypothetical protein
MQNISAEALDKVFGGTTPANNGASGSSSSSGCSSSDQLLTAVQGIESSIKDLKHNQNQGLFGGQNGALMFLMMGLAFSRRNDTVVINGGGYHGGYWYRSGW